VVQDPERDGDLGVPPILGAETQAVADDAFLAAEERLDQGADVVPGGFLPGHAAVVHGGRKAEDPTLVS
jgi:hypothetical protein